MLAMDTYRHMQEVATSAAHHLHPNVDAIVKQLAPNDLHRQGELLQHARECVKPAIDYFLRRFSHVEGDLYPIIRASMQGGSTRSVAQST